MFNSTLKTEDVRLRAVELCDGDHTLVGTVYTPNVFVDEGAGIGLVMVAARPQYRAGPHAQFVNVAMAAARCGITTLLFDLPGVGDSASNGRARVQSVRAAVDCLIAHGEDIRSVCLYGLCDSASLVVECAELDARVTSVAISNPSIEGAQIEAREKLRGYYATRLRSGTFWRDLFSGQINVAQSLFTMMGTIRSYLYGERRTGNQNQPLRMANAMLRLNKPIIMFISGQDRTGRMAQDLFATDARWQQLNNTTHVEIVLLENADHTFTDAEDEAIFVQKVLKYLLSASRASLPPTS